MRRIIPWLAALAALSSCGPDARAPEAPTDQAARAKPVIFDHDGGIDDYAALLMLIGAEGFALDAVTVGFGNSFRDPALEASRRILSSNGLNPPLAGYSEGDRGPNAFPDAWRRMSYQVAALESLGEGSAVSGPGAAAAQGAVELLRSRIGASARPVSILATGPLTNIAAALEGRDDLLENIEQVVIMGGAVRVEGNTGFEPPERGDGTAEYNFFADPEAAQAVLGLAARGVRIVLVPLDATRYLPLDTEFVDGLLGSPAPNARRAGEILNLLRGELDSGDYFLWDGAAVLALIEPALFRYERMRLRVETQGTAQGRVEESPEGAGPIQTAVGLSVSGEALEAARSLLESR